MNREQADVTAKAMQIVQDEIAEIDRSIVTNMKQVQERIDRDHLLKERRRHMSRLLQMLTPEEDAAAPQQPDERTYRRYGPVKAFGAQRCAYCLTWTDNPHRDHVVPFSKGGSDSPDNLVPACASCNSKKHAMTLLEFVAIGGIA